jgi:hypothetical protein
MHENELGQKKDHPKDPLDRYQWRDWKTNKSPWRE